MRLADTIGLVWFTVFNALTLLAFGFDKWRAGGSGQRVSELSLILLGAFGGWPGGLLGMKLFRHKTAKRSFMFKYSLGLIPFMAGVWAWWLGR